LHIHLLGGKKLGTKITRGQDVYDAI